MVRKISNMRYPFAVTVNFGALIFTVGPLSHFLIFCSIRLGNTQMVVSLDAISMALLEPTVSGVPWCRFEILDETPPYVGECSEIVSLIKKKHGDSDLIFFNVVKKFLGPASQEEGSTEYALGNRRTWVMLELLDNPRFLKALFKGNL